MCKILHESTRRYMQLKLNPWKALGKYQSEYICFYIHLHVCGYTLSCATADCQE